MHTKSDVIRQRVTTLFRSKGACTLRVAVFVVRIVNFFVCVCGGGVGGGGCSKFPENCIYFL